MVTQNPQGGTDIQTITQSRRERILKAWEMYEGGAKVREIAQFFGISRRMVHHDLKLAPKLLKEEVQTFDPGEILGKEIAFWRQIIRQAMRNYELAQSENAKIGFLRVATEARSRLQKFLQETGIITTVPTRVSIEEANPFSADPELRKEYLGLLKKARERGLNLGGL